MQLLFDLKSQMFRAAGTVSDNRTKKCSVMTKQEMKKRSEVFPITVLIKTLNIMREMA